MGLVSKTIAGIFNGVSQQAPPLRRANQADEQINFISSIADGIARRQGTRHIAKLSSRIHADAITHPFTDSYGNDYLIVITGDADEPIEVYDLSGNKRTISYEGKAKSYISSTIDCISNLRITSIGDYSIVANKSITCLMSDETDPLPDPFAIYWVKKGVSMTEYFLGDQTYTTGEYSSTTGENTNNICAHFGETVSGCTHLDGKGSVCRITGTQEYIDELTASDSYGNQGAILIKGSVPKMADLPPYANDGDILEVSADKTKDTGAYWVKYNKSKNRWEETTPAGQKNKFNADTLPHQLIRTEDGNFLFRAARDDDSGYAYWEPRKVGNDDAAPIPSFIDTRISEIFFFKGRLGFLSGQNIIMSKPNDFFNFFPETVMSVLDNDPIDITCGSAMISGLLWAVPYRESMMVFSDNTQFVLGSGSDILTASTASPEQSTSYPCSKKCRPLMIGSDMFFVADNNRSWSTVREYFMQPDSQVDDAADITAHCKAYVPANLVKLVKLDNYDMLFCLPYNSGKLAVYRYYWQGSEKPMSAWFTLEYDYFIYGLEIFDNTLYLIVCRDGEIHLEKMEFDNNDEWYLDRFTEAEYQLDTENEISSITLPYTDSSDMGNWRVLVETSDGKISEAYSIIGKDGNTFILDRLIPDGAMVYTGKCYHAEFKFSEWFIPDSSSNSGVIQGILQIKTMTLSFKNTVDYSLFITAKNRTTIQHYNSGIEIRSARFNELKTRTGRERYWVQGDSKDTTIRLVVDGSHGAMFDSISYEGSYYKRSSFI